MDEWQYEQAQQREEDERAAAIKRVREKAARRFTPYMLDGEACCPECLEPLPTHRIEVGICVKCRGMIEKRERDERV